MGQRIERCCSSSSVTTVDDSAVDAELLVEWNRLTKREHALEYQLNRIEQKVHQKYPEIGIAKKIICKIIHIDRRSRRLGRILALLRMRDRAVKLIEVAEREMATEQKKARMELDEIDIRLIEIEDKIEDQVRKRRSGAQVEVASKRLRNE